MSYYHDKGPDFDDVMNVFTFVALMALVVYLLGWVIA